MPLGNMMNKKLIVIDTGLQKTKVLVSKIVEIKTSKKVFIYFDKNEDGTFNMSYTTGMFNDIVPDEEPKVRLNYIRENEWKPKKNGYRR
jgi:hypothetical protein